MTTELRRRADAAHRMAGGDPWPIRIRPEEQLDGRQLGAWAAAAQHILQDHLSPIVPFDVLRALFRQGGDLRALAERIHRSGGAMHYSLSSDLCGGDA